MAVQKKKKRKYRYLVYPRNKHTNDVLAADRNFGDIGEMACSDGKNRYMFEAQSHMLVAYLQRSKNQLQIDFEVFI